MNSFNEARKLGHSGWIAARGLRLSIFRSLLVCGLFLALSSTAQAQEFWVKKDYETWTEMECRKVLEDSPWAKTRVIGKAMLQELATRTLERARENAPQVEYRVQLRSAWPLRQALVRLQMIAAGYDKLTPAQRKDFNAQAEKFLAAQFPDTIILYVEYSTNTLGYSRDLANYWRTRTTGLLQDVRLHTPRGQFPLLNYVHSGGDVSAFQLTFARQAGGEPILNPQDDVLKLEFNHPIIGDIDAERILMTFKVQDLILKGKLVF
jgi:hypothetical protein